MNSLFTYVDIVGTRSEVFAMQVALTVFGLVWSNQNVEAFTTLAESKLYGASPKAEVVPRVWIPVITVAFVIRSSF